MPQSDSHAELKRVRSLLLILMATCQQTLLGLDASANVLDAEMTETLRKMIARSEKELVVLTETLNEAAS